MLHHIALIRFKEQPSDENIEALGRLARRIKADVAGTHTYEFGCNADPRSQGYDWGIVAVFETRAAYEAYQTSAAHEELRGFLRPLLDSIAIFHLQVGGDAA